MKRTFLKTILTGLLLVFFIADTTNVSSLHIHYHFVHQEVNAQTDSKCVSAPDELFKRAPLKHHIKFIDIDSPLLQPHIVASFFSETIHYRQVTVCENASPPASLISLHKLCILLI